ncbi:MAG: LLM class flavin-dependent oxidoreductase [Alphaproteobacteria bacterium]
MQLTFGTFNLMQRRNPARTDRELYSEMIEHVRLAEELGFDTAWIAEHHFNNYSLSPSPLIALSHLAAVTRTIKLGSAVLVLPFYEPVRVIQEIAMVDILSNGRLQVGVGSGYQDYEFQRFRERLDAAMEMTAELLDIMELAYTQDSFAYDGKHYKIPETRISISCVQRPMPPMWVAGMMGNAQIKRRVAAKGYTPFLAAALSPIEKLVPIRAAYDEAYREVGVDPLVQPMGVMRYFHLTDSQAEARDAAERCRYSTRVSLSLRLDYAKLNGIVVEERPVPNEASLDDLQRNMVIGDAHVCAARIVEDFEALRATHFALYIQPGDLSHARVMHSLEKFAKECVPLVAKEIGKRGHTVAFGKTALRQSAAE